MYRTRKHFFSALWHGLFAVALIAGVIGTANSLKAQSRERAGDNSTPQEPIARRPLASSSDSQGKTIVTSPSATTAVTAAQTRAWSSAGSDGSMDQTSAALAQLKSFAVSFQPTLTGSINIKYNITAVEGINSFCPATQSNIKVRFRNSDPSGVQSRLTFDIHSSSITAGGDNIVYSFNSDGKSFGSVFTTFTDASAPIDFDFTNNIYWIDATIRRDSAALYVDLGSIQIWESAGTPCP